MNTSMMQGAGSGSDSLDPITLTDRIEELETLRFSIILAARWEANRGLDAEYRAELAEELVRLRSEYLDRIDDVAMEFGVQRAMDAKEEVERSVVVPRGLNPPQTMSEAEQMSR